MPDTEAGRALLEREALNSRSFALITEDRITAIEQQARSRALAEVRARVEGLSRQMQHADPFFPETYDYETVGLSAVLAAIEEVSRRG